MAQTAAHPTQLANTAEQQAPAKIGQGPAESAAPVKPNQSKSAKSERSVTRPAFDAEPDLVGRMVAFIGQERPELDADTLAAVEQRLRQEFGGDTVYVAKQTTRDRGDLVAQVRRMFNGRNATEIARRLKIGRATVYRMVKTAGER
jgi:hypothetical protein